MLIILNVIIANILNFRGESLNFKSGLPESIDFSVENHLLSSNDAASTVNDSTNPPLQNRHLTSTKRQENSFVTSSLLQTNEGIQPSYIHSIHNSMIVSGYQDDLERDNNLQFLPSEGTFQVLMNSSAGDTSVMNISSNVVENNPNVQSHYQLSSYHPINANQSYPYQQPLQLSQVPIVSPYSTLGQMLSRNNEQSAFPNFINSFLRHQNNPAQASPTSHNTKFGDKNERSCRSLGISRRQDTKPYKARGEGNKLLSTRATYVLEGWYEANTDWPYPSKAEKQVMASAGGITIEQVTISLTTLYA